MEDDKRAEGFWWVRFEGDAWSVREVIGDELWGESFDPPSTISEIPPTIIEWGPYLGKEPGACHWCARPLADHPPPLMVVTVDGARPATPEEEAEHERQRAVQRMMLAEVEASRIPPFNPSTDYEGEDTRALDGAGTTIPLDGFDEGPFGYTTSLLAAVLEEPKP